MELWKDIDGYEGIYQVSNLGNVRSFHSYGGVCHINKHMGTYGSTKGEQFNANSR